MGNRVEGLPQVQGSEGVPTSLRRVVVEETLQDQNVGQGAINADEAPLVLV
jgi:hypothetical protein